MFGRKHKQSTKQKIANSLRRKASKAIVKGAGAAGYVVGRVGPYVANAKVTKIASKAGTKALDKTPSKVKKAGAGGVDKVTRVIGQGASKLERGTRLKASASFVGGAAKGSTKTIRKEYAKQKRKAS